MIIEKTMKMNKFGNIYFTEEYNSDGEILNHKGIAKIGIGKTNDDVRRFKEHHLRGSKASVGVDFMNIINCDEIGIQDGIVESKIHKILLDNGFINIDRISHYKGDELKSTTEVFSGKSNRTIKGVFNKGDELSNKLLLNITYCLASNF